MLATLTMISALLVLLTVGLPVAVALGLVGLAGVALKDPTYLIGAALSVWNTVDNYVLLSVPLFVLMGELFQRSNLATKFYEAASRWIAWLPGGLLHSNILACSIFSAISGSSVATAATIGSIAVPEMQRLGYDRKQVFGSLAAGGTLGILIPPSIPLILYAAIVEASVGKLFAASVFPGILLTIAFIAYIFFANLKSGRSLGKFELAPALKAGRDLVPLFLLIVVVLGSIYLGIATATEAAAVGVFGTIVVAALYKSFSIRMLVEALLSTARFTAIIMFIVIGAQIFSYAVFVWGATVGVKEWVLALTPSPLLVVGFIVLGYLIIGMFVDAISMMVLTLSLTHPLVLAMGYDTIWFGVVLVITLEIGLITPPVGLNLFTMQSIAGDDISIKEISAGALPYVFIMIAFLVILIIFPQIVLFPVGLTK